MSDARLFSLYLPASVGGLELDPVGAFSVTEALARADGSTAWCAMVSCSVGVFLGLLEPDGLTEVAGDVGDVRLAGSARPCGTCVPVDGGYRVTGHWNFASNVLNANWYVATCWVEEPGAEGPPTRTRTMVLPVQDGTIDRTWEVMGMRGTGSNDFIVEDVFVPHVRVAYARNRQYNATRLYHPQFTQVASWSPTAGMSIGVAQGAIDTLGLLGDVQTSMSTKPLRDRPEVQLAVGEAQAMVSAARAYCRSAIGEAWERLEEPDSPERDRVLAHARASITHATRSSVQAVDRVFHAAGTGAIFADNGLERFFRDAHTGVQHISSADVHLAGAGAVFLGHPLDGAFLK